MNPLFRRSTRCSMQTVEVNGKAFRRLADGRGWVQERNPDDNSVLFEEAAGKLTEDR